MGLRFIPFINSSPVAQTRINEAFSDHFSRSLRLRAFFDQTPASPKRTGTFVSAFYIPNPNWHPPKRDRILAYEQYLHDTGTRLKAAVSSMKHYRTSGTVDKIVRAFKERKDIIILPSDKNLGLVVMKTQDYVAMVMDHLADASKYKEIHESERALIERVSSTYAPLAKALGFHFHEIQTIAPFLQQGMHGQVKIPLFHVLPKIHKSPVKGRPIAGAVKWITTYPSALLSHVLKPHAAKCTQILRDSKSLIPLLESLHIPDGALLVTLDITALYPNMDQAKTIALINRLPLSPDIKHLLTETTRFILENSYVEFDSKIYHQIDGMPMGTNAAVELANLFGDAYIDNHAEIRAQTSALSLIYRRYIDDIFMIWTGTREELQTFHALINSIDPKLAFTIASSSESIAFLDLQIAIKDNRIRISTFQKSMNRYLYIPYQSNHPPAAKRGFIKGELIRYVRNSSDRASFEHTRWLFLLRLRARGYPRTFIESVFPTVQYSDRDQWLKDKTKDAPEQINGKPVHQNFLKLTFNKSTQELNAGRILRLYVDALNANDEVKSFIEPIVSYKRGKNLADYLISSRFGSLRNELKRNETSNRSIDQSPDRKRTRFFISEKP